MEHCTNYIFVCIFLSCLFTISFFQLPVHNNRGSGYQKSMVATELVPIMLRRGPEVIWFNEMVNSPFGICQLRLSYEKESDGNIFQLNFCCSWGNTMGYSSCMKGTFFQRKKAKSVKYSKRLIRNM